MPPTHGCTGWQSRSCNASVMFKNRGTLHPPSFYITNYNLSLLTARWLVSQLLVLITKVKIPLEGERGKLLFSATSASLTLFVDGCSFVLCVLRGWAVGEMKCEFLLNVWSLLPLNVFCALLITVHGLTCFYLRIRWILAAQWPYLYLTL